MRKIHTRSRQNDIPLRIVFGYRISMGKRIEGVRISLYAVQQFNAQFFCLFHDVLKLFFILKISLFSGSEIRHHLCKRRS